MEGVRPAIRVRIDQCREKKSYINIYYVDKSMDKSSLARALSLRVSAFFLLESPTCQSSPKSSPSRTASTATRATWEVRAGQQLGLAGGTGRRDLGPDPCPSPPGRLEVGVSVPDGLPRPRSAATGPAGGWREEGRSRAPRPARPPWKETGSGCRAGSVSQSEGRA